MLIYYVDYRRQGGKCSNNGNMFHNMLSTSQVLYRVAFEAIVVHNANIYYQHDEFYLNSPLKLSPSMTMALVLTPLMTTLMTSASQVVSEIVLS